MRDISISEFKANCHALIEKVVETRRPLRITRRGRTVVEIVPTPTKRGRFVLGGMAGTGEIVGDILSPVILGDA